MRIIIVLMTSLLIHVHATSRAQQVTIKSERITLKQAFNEVRKQTGFYVLYRADQVRNLKPVSLNMNNVPLEEAMKAILLGSDLEFIIKNKAVILSEKENPSFLDKVVDAFIPPIDVSGVVLDEKGAPLVGATVKVKGVSQSTTTDAQGRFSLPNVDDKAVLVITFIGYTPKEVAVKATLSISLEVQPSELQEVVVAYGKTTQQALTGAVTVINGDQIQNLPNRSLDKSLQGLVPGLQVTNGTGQPGGGLASFVLRGIATGGVVNSNSISRNPLFVIDGVPVSQESFQSQSTFQTGMTNPMAQLNPSDIETISVLKDAAAIALYGAKASNGVIIITTKKGKAGQPLFNFRSQTDFSTRMKESLKLLNQEQYLQLMFETYKNTDPIAWTEDKIRTDLKSKFPIKADGSFYPAPDWNAAVFENNAVTASNEISLSGGSEKSTYYINLEYLKQKGIVKETGFDRKSLRVNFENRPNSSLKIGINTTLSHNFQRINDPFESADGFGAATIISPLNPVRREDGQYILVYPFGFSSGVTINPEAKGEFNINNNTSYRGLTSLYGELSFLKSFKFKSLVGVDFMLNNEKVKVSPIFSAASNLVPAPSIRERDVTRSTVINTNTLTFNRTFHEKHSLNILLAEESQIRNQRDLGAGVRGTKETLDFYDEMSSPGYTINNYAGFSSKQTQLSFFTQLSYGFNNKYFLTGSARADGSSRFGDQQRWGKFWSSGIGWVVSNESFLQSSKKWLSYFKIRGSIGAAGNTDAINAYTRFDLISLARFDGKQVLIPELSPGNPDIKWEKTKTWDMGIESKFFDNRLAFTADFYNRNTSDVIYSTILPSVTGSTLVLDNIGNMRNTGVEMSLTAHLIRQNSFSWNLSVNWSKNENKLIKANIPLERIGSNNTTGNEEGRNFNSFYMPVWAGVNPSTGRPQWYNSTGDLTSVYSQAERRFVGKSQPDGFGSITNIVSYKNFQLLVSLYYQYGFQVFDDRSTRYLQTDGQQPYFNQTVDALDYWRKPGDIASNPKRILNNPEGGRFTPSTRFLYDGDFIKLQNMNLSYNIPQALVSKIKLKSLKIYLQGNNLAYLSKSKRVSPDNSDAIGVSGFNYPNSKSISVGINAQF